jgi:hypothetical protein
MFYFRNEVWRYPPANNNRYEQYFKCWCRGKPGLTIAFGLAGLVIGAEQAYNYYYPPVHHHKKPYFKSSSVELQNN